uniref:caspase-3 isoform X1 n=2 Tax=Myxine glutinosa TaxID=7769 RepID=UPI00358E7013
MREMADSDTGQGDSSTMHSHEDQSDQLDAFPNRKARPLLFPRTNPSVSTPKEAMDEAESLAYNLDKKTFPEKPLFVLINNENFLRKTGMNKRSGTVKDARNLMQCFTALGFKTDVKQNLTCREMYEYMYSVSKQDHSKRPCFMCAILSHGEKDLIYGIDDTMDFKQLSSCFRGDVCKSLVGKPKIFIVQACRGQEFDDGIQTDAVSQSNNSVPTIPVEADFLYCYSTVLGYYSWRNPERGSWFVQALTEVLNDKGTELEIMRLLTKVNHKVALEFESLSDDQFLSGKKQIPCIMSMLTKEFYFKYLC